MLTLIWIHFVADFLLQNDSMAINKSSSNKWLGIHCLIYGLCFIMYGVQFAIIAGLSHFVIDYCTSRVNKKLWANDQRHWFFTNIGFDQALHMTVLFLLLSI